MINLVLHLLLLYKLAQMHANGEPITYPVWFWGWKQKAKIFKPFIIIKSKKRECQTCVQYIFSLQCPQELWSMWNIAIFLDMNHNTWEIYWLKTGKITYYTALCWQSQKVKRIAILILFHYFIPFLKSVFTLFEFFKHIFCQET